MVSLEHLKESSSNFPKIQKFQQKKLKFKTESKQLEKRFEQPKFYRKVYLVTYKEITLHILVSSFNRKKPKNFFPFAETRVFVWIISDSSSICPPQIFFRKKICPPRFFFSEKTLFFLENFFQIFLNEFCSAIFSQ